MIEADTSHPLAFGDTLKTIDITIPKLPAAQSQCGKVVKLGWSEEASYWVQRAYEMSGCDKEFLYMLEGENGGWDYKAQSQVWKDGIREDSWGFCQIHRRWHADIVDDPRFFTDQEWQLSVCLEEWRTNPWKFHGYKDSRHKAVTHFTFL